MDQNDIVQEMFTLGYYYRDRGYICQRSWDLFIQQKENNIAKLKQWMSEEQSIGFVELMQDRLTDNENYLQFARDHYQGHSTQIFLEPGINIIELLTDRDS